MGECPPMLASKEHQHNLGHLQRDFPKEMEFLELKQENMTVADYTTKFEELFDYFPHCNGEGGECSTFVKFVHDLCLEKMQAIIYRDLPVSYSNEYTL